MSTVEPIFVSERVRKAAAWVIARADSVAIDEAAIAAYAAALPDPAPPRSRNTAY